ncbi:MAG: sulfatase [candidate division KSB1 bacterium]|nr:sulfatase [candidate division KSB1 bacterium]
MTQTTRRHFLQTCSAGFAAAALGTLPGCSQPKSLPNLVIIFTDDQGYADVGVYGAQGFETPNLDQMAQAGRRFTDFHVASPVCSPSRAALLTGCYPQRVGLPMVLFPDGPEWTKGKSELGLNENETTLAELLKSKGYRTACYGKWHLGHHEPFLPVNHGFDDYFGLPYSNDMRPEDNPAYPPLPLIQGTEVIEENPDQSLLTRRYTQKALEFINKNADQPFFLYLAHSMPHVPLYRSDRFAGISEQGVYGDVIREIDWSVGQVLKTLKDNGLDDNTLIVFVSDNGPWTVFGNHGGSAGPLRGCKQTVFEGGQRVPCIMRWPGKIPENSVCDSFATTMDMLPTMAALVNADLPPRKIDGHDIRPLVFADANAETPYEAFYYYDGPTLKAVRSGKWKLHVPHDYKGVKQAGMDGEKGTYFYQKIELSLFDLEQDINEDQNVADQHPEVVQRLLAAVEQARADLGDHDRKGKGVRPCGHLKDYS